MNHTTIPALPRRCRACLLGGSQPPAAAATTASTLTIYAGRSQTSSARCSSSSRRTPASGIRVALRRRHRPRSRHPRRGQQQPGRRLLRPGRRRSRRAQGREPPAATCRSDSSTRLTRPSARPTGSGWASPAAPASSSTTPTRSTRRRCRRRSSTTRSRSGANRVGIVPRSDGFPEFVTALRLITRRGVRAGSG